MPSSLAGTSLLAGGQRGQLVRAIVVDVQCVAFRPRPFHPMPRDLLIEVFPEIAVHNGLFLRRDPAAFFPSGDPLRDAVLQVFGIRHDLNLALFLQYAKAFNRGRELHAVVRRVGLAAVNFFLVRTMAQYRGPSSGTWIS